MPSLEDLVANSSIDIDALESQFSSLSFKSSKLKASSLGGQAASPKSPKSLAAKSPLSAVSTGGGKVAPPPSSTVAAANNKLKKRKRKVKLPKNPDPNAHIDPERWLPLRERSYYKGRRNKKKSQQVGKGTQGAVSSK